MFWHRPTQSSPAQRYAATLVNQFPTTGLSAIYADQVRHLIDYVKRSYTGEHRELLHRIPLIVLGRSDLDVCVTTVPGFPKEAIILIGPKYLISLHLMLRIGFWLFFHYQSVNESILSDLGYELVQLFASLTLHVPSQQTQLTRAVDDDAELRQSAIDQEALYDCIVFIILHEFMHVASGHLSSSAKRRSRLLRNRPTEFYRFSQECETEADHRAASFLFSLGPKPPEANPFLPPGTFRDAAPFFACTFIGAMDYLRFISEASLIKRFESTFRRADFTDVDSIVTIQKTHSTHPFGMDRWQGLMDAFGERMNDHNRNMAIQFAQYVYQGLSKLDSRSWTLLDNYANELLAQPTARFISNLNALAAIVNEQDSGTN